MRPLLMVALLSMACAARAPVAPAPGEEPSLVIANATLIDSTGPPRPHQTLVVRGHRIAYAGPAETAPRARGAR